ncbi:MAG: MlaD family protein [Propionivibrio sp.]
MMENRSHALIAGLFLLIIGLSGIAALWWFSGRQDDTNSYVVETRRSVTGLNVQAQVRYRGIRVGKVLSIRLDPSDARTTLIGISVRNDIPITQGTVARLGYQGVTGIAHVQLEDDGRDPRGLASAARIAMQDSMIQELSDVGADTLRQMRELLIGVNELLRPENRKVISKTLANLESATAQASETTARLQQLLSADNVRRVNSVLAKAEQTAAQAAPFFSEARGLIARLQSASEKFETALGDTSTSGVGALAPRLNELSAELASTSHQLNRVLLMLEESPQSLIFGRQNAQPGPGEPGFAAPPIVRERP